MINFLIIHEAICKLFLFSFVPYLYWTSECQEGGASYEKYVKIRQMGVEMVFDCMWRRLWPFLNTCQLRLPLQSFYNSKHTRFDQLHTGDNWKYLSVVYVLGNYYIRCEMVLWLCTKLYFLGIYIEVFLVDMSWCL